MAGRKRFRLPFIVLCCALALSGCVSVIPKGGTGQPAALPPSTRPDYPIPPATPNPPVSGPAVTPGAVAEQAIGLPLRQGPDPASLTIGEADARAALIAFRLSCPSLTRRTDNSGLTRPEDWRGPCDAAVSWSDNDARRFFVTQFETLQVGDGNAFATGYFEPEIAGVRNRQPGYDAPVYGRPNDLVDVDLGQFNPDLQGKSVRGKVSGTKLVLYDERGEIESGSLAGRAPIIAWAADPVELFFLQVQGSGRLRAPDGSIIRIGYAAQNGRSYTGIGKLMKDRGLIGPTNSNMQGIVDWLHAHPQEGKAIMDENKSYVFFREITGPGPLGALGYPVVAESSVAADPKFVPLGAPVFLSMDRAEPNGLWVAQDTGGAIRGANRFDTYWGAGDRARTIAGGMSARGQALILVPLGSFDRLSAAAP